MFSKPVCYLFVALLGIVSPLVAFAQATESAKLTASDPGLDLFGFSVAIEAETIVIGAESGDGMVLDDQGAVYVFKRVGADWTQSAKLTALDGAIGDKFGHSVAISDDSIAIGAPNEDGPGGTNRGAVYVFVRNGDNWNHQAKLVSSQIEPFSEFGGAVAIDGDTLVVGATFDDGPGGSSQGSIYVFSRSGSSWTHQARLQASDGDAFDFLGGSVALDGDSAIAGARRAEGLMGGFRHGAAYIFTRNGTSWSQQAKLTAPDAMDEDELGYAVALDGDTALVSSLHGGGAVPNTGSVYIFERSGTAWTLQQEIFPANPSGGNSFGFSLDIDCNSLVVGDPNEFVGGIQTGAAFVFARNSIGVWTERATLIASDAESADFLGCAAGISNETVVVGNYLDDGTTVVGQGSAYVFSFPVCLRADVDQSGFVDGGDIDLFSKVLLNFPSGDPWLDCAADVNADGVADKSDIEPFVTCLILGTCPPLCS